VGDIQPIDEVSCYSFCELLLELVKELGGTEVITLGGIGLQQIPKKPKVYVTGAQKKTVDEYKKKLGVQTGLYGIVGPIVGVTGVLLGLAPRAKIRSVGLLVETFGHPMYLGVKGAKELLNVLKKRLGLKINLKKMETEIEELEKEVLKKTKELRDVGTKRAIRKARKGSGELSYIG
jgi:proteasome assembly chaperone (PAC2) family protein